MRRSTPQTLTLLTIVMVGLLIGGCGQRGPLRMPQATPTTAAKPAGSTPATPPASSTSADKTTERSPTTASGNR